MLSDTLTCSNWITPRATDNIINWRNFRNNITKNHISVVAEAWANCRTVEPYLEYDDYRHWPDPWTLISSGMYDETALALGIFYTLYFTSYKQKSSMVIEVYRDRKKHEYLNLVRCEDGLYTLNYQPGAVVNNLTISDTAELINTVTPKQLHI